MSRDTQTLTHRTPAFVWGYNNTGGLGLGHTARAYQPVPTSLPPDVVDVQGGVEFTVALTRAGEVHTWGGNEAGQLGTPDVRTRRTPARLELPGGARARAIAVGTDHVLVLTRSGNLLAWGSNHWGQLGDGTTEDRHQPVRIRTREIASIAAGNAISVAVTRRGDVLTWGRNNHGQLAQSSEAEREVHTPTAARLPRGTQVRAVDAGRHHLVVLTETGRLLSFGLDGFGHAAPSELHLKSAWGRVRSISAGDEFTLALTNRHVLLGWGQNLNGQLGQGDTLARVHPTAITLPRADGHVIDLQAGARSATVLTSAHEVFTWGETRMGQGGNGQADDNQLKPRRVASLRQERVRSLHGGAHHTVLTAKHGSAVGLLVTPAVATARPGQAVSYRVHEVDKFGTDLGPTHHRVSLQIVDGEAVGRTVRAHTLGTHRVTARADKLTGTASLLIKKDQ
ncbi:MAG: hypothetical protein ABWX96_15060 [Propionibacteriaceae bacterium]